MADIGLPKIDIIFRGLGVSAINRGSKGYAVLILKDDTDKEFKFKEYKSVADLGEEEASRYTPENLQYIRDCLEGTPRSLLVARMDKSLEEGESSEAKLSELLKELSGKVKMNCWMAIADASQSETDSLVSFIKSANKNNKKRYKAIVHGATQSDDMHIVNNTNPKVTFKDERGEQDGDVAIPFLLGLVSGASLDMSLIAYVLQKFESVEEPENLEEAINSGQFVLRNDEGEVKVARAVNSLITTGQGITDDMKFILIVEVMDLIYTDIYTTWKRSYQGKYKNSSDNQMLLIGAINAYFRELSISLLLDPSYQNRAGVNVEKQRNANIPKYGEDAVSSWEDDKVIEMTVGTNVFLGGKLKILNAMEDFDFDIAM